MNKALAEEAENTLRDTKYKHLKIATGGRGPVDPLDPCWLKRYTEGTFFRAKRKGDYIVPLFAIDNCSDRTYVLIAEGQGQIPVDPIAFCQVWQLHEIVRTAEETMLIAQKIKQEQEKETSDGKLDGTVRHSDVDNNGDAET